MNTAIVYSNPFRPGAGHMPPYLAGRDPETGEFQRLLAQETILENLVLTGLRGVGKTVLLDTFKPLAIEAGWRWAGTDLSESASISEDNIATRLLTDLSVVTSDLIVAKENIRRVGFDAPELEVPVKLGYEVLRNIYRSVPGLTADKLKTVLEVAWAALQPTGARGLIFAYDESQNLSDQAAKEQYPLSLLLDVFQSIQKRDIRLMLVLTGLPTLFPKLVEARTFTERMFRVLFLDRLDEADSRDAILKPIKADNWPVRLTDESVNTIIYTSGGYPYFIQFICKEVYDAFIQKLDTGEEISPVPIAEIIQKLDSDFFAGRWARATDRQRDLLRVISQLHDCDYEFTVQAIVEQSKKMLAKPFSSSHVNQMLVTLSNAGLVYKNRHGKYAFAVPLLGQFIQRQPPQTIPGV